MPIFFENFCAYVHEEVVCFFCTIFIWFWYRGNTVIQKKVLESVSSPSVLWKKLYRIDLTLSYLIEFFSNTIWKFVFQKLLNYRSIFLTYIELFKLSISFMVNFGGLCYLRNGLVSCNLPISRSWFWMTYCIRCHHWQKLD